MKLAPLVEPLPLLLLLSFVGVQSNDPVIKRVKYSSQRTSIDINDNVYTIEPPEEEDIPVECYQFTWLGPADELTVNGSMSNCNYFDALDIPCFEPIVYTEGPYASNGPDLDALVELCKDPGNLQGVPCDPKCQKADGQTCVRMTYYIRDDEDTVALQTQFCGKGFMMSSNGKAIQNGCHKQKQHGEEGIYDLEACFCNTDLCNASTRLEMSAIAALLLLLPFLA